jgi:hypothetical protein
LCTPQSDTDSLRALFTTEQLLSTAAARNASNSLLGTFRGLHPLTSDIPFDYKYLLNGDEVDSASTAAAAISQWHEELEVVRLHNAQRERKLRLKQRQNEGPTSSYGGIRAASKSQAALQSAGTNMPTDEDSTADGAADPIRSLTATHPRLIALGNEASQHRVPALATAADAAEQTSTGPTTLHNGVKAFVICGGNVDVLEGALRLYEGGFTLDSKTFGTYVLTANDYGQPGARIDCGPSAE